MMTQTIDRVNLLDLDREGLIEFCEQMGEKRFRAIQLLRWIHRHCVGDFEKMTDLAKSFRTKLIERTEIRAPIPVWDKKSADGTRKWLFDVGNGNAVETVFIPEDDRGTLCVSTQAGCAMGCLFCSTGKQGFNRNLKTSEIIGQLWHAEKTLREDMGITDPADRVISNVVLMGMGEPLQNLDNVITALKLMLDDNGYGLSRRRVTVSTCGLTLQMDKLAAAVPVALAVSLHAPTDELRDQIMPINKKHPLADLMHSPLDYFTFEYLLMVGVKDRLEHARALVKLVKGVSCKFNLIPFNPFPDSDLKKPDPKDVKAFQDYLIGQGIVTTVRKTRGDDIDAACGQLAGNIKDKTRRAERLVIQKAQATFLAKES